MNHLLQAQNGLIVSPSHRERKKTAPIGAALPIGTVSIVPVELIRYIVFLSLPQRGQSSGDTTGLCAQRGTEQPTRLRASVGDVVFFLANRRAAHKNFFFLAPSGKKSFCVWSAAKRFFVRVAGGHAGGIPPHCPNEDNTTVIEVGIFLVFT